jgi:hypothetical protein
MSGSATGDGRANVRFGSKADIAAYSINVCFTPESGHRLGKLACPLCAALSCAIASGDA